MKKFYYARGPSGRVIGIAMTGWATVARANIKDYEFPLNRAFKKGGVIISVCLVHNNSPAGDACSSPSD